MSFDNHGQDAPAIADFSNDDVPAAPAKIQPRAEDAHDHGWPSGDDNAHDGGPGDAGLLGFTGADGLNGGDSPTLDVTISVAVDGALAINVRGGNGARGQMGGRGGQGGEGQDGGNAAGDGAAGRGGRGGVGGKGGRGGSGGDGGNASNVKLTLSNPTEVVLDNIQSNFSRGSKGGRGPGGRGGPGGEGGAGSSRGNTGNEGAEGEQGASAGTDGGTGFLELTI